MINITYLPSNDPFHAVFRIFVLFPTSESAICPYDTARLLDFYVCFPFLISGFQCPRPLVKRHNALKRLYTANTYQATPKPAALFNTMRSAHSAATNSLRSYGFLEAKALQDGIVSRTGKKMPDRVSTVVTEYRKNHAQLIEFLEELKSLSPYGTSGLRARSELGEYRYDDV